MKKDMAVQEAVTILADAAKEVEKTLEGKIPYMVIETRDYGMMRGDLVLEQAIKKIESFHA